MTLTELYAQHSLAIGMDARVLTELITVTDRDEPERFYPQLHANPLVVTAWLLSSGRGWQEGEVTEALEHLIALGEIEYDPTTYTWWFPLAAPNMPVTQPRGPGHRHGLSPLLSSLVPPDQINTEKGT